MDDIDATKTYVNGLFKKTDINHDLVITKGEINKARKARKISQDETTLLNASYELQRANNDNSFDNGQDMELWEYLQAAGRIRYRGLFSEEDIRQANRKLIIDNIDNVDGERLYFEHANATLKSNRSFILNIVKRCGTALSDVPETFQDDKAIVLAAIMSNGGVLSYASDRLRNNKAVVLAAVSNDTNFFLPCWGALYNASESLKKDEEIQLAAIKNNPEMLKCIGEDSESLLSNPEFQKKAFEANFNCFVYMKYPSQELSNEYESLIGDLHNRNIWKTERLSTMSAREIIRNRDNVGINDGRPLALFIFAKNDWNGAFKYRQYKIEQAIRAGYKVMYYEVSSDEKFISALKRAGENQKVSLIVIVGHGAIDSLAFGASDPDHLITEEDRSHLDAGDKEKLTGLSRYMEDGGTIILESCSTGKGGEQAVNIANMLSNEFPNVHIFSPLVDERLSVYSFGPNGKVTDVEYNGGPEHLYHIAPKVNFKLIK